MHCEICSAARCCPYGGGGECDYRQEVSRLREALANQEKLLLKLVRDSKYVPTENREHYLVTRIKALSIMVKQDLEKYPWAGLLSGSQLKEKQ